MEGAEGLRRRGKGEGLEQAGPEVSGDADCDEGAEDGSEKSSAESDDEGVCQALERGAQGLGNTSNSQLDTLVVSDGPPRVVG